MPRKEKKPLHIKIRVKLLRPMMKSEAVKKLRRTVETGIVQEGIELGYVDWRSGKGTHVKSGTYLDQDALNALVEFHAAITAATKTRIAVVEDGKGEE